MNRSGFGRQMKPGLVSKKAMPMPDPMAEAPMTPVAPVPKKRPVPPQFAQNKAPPFQPAKTGPFSHAGHTPPPVPRIPGFKKTHKKSF
jgi:hypothetical protein